MTTSEGLRVEPLGDEPLAAPFQVAHDSEIAVGDRRYRRITVATPWIEGPTDLAEVLRTGLGPHLRAGDTAFVVEKLAVVATGRVVWADTITVSPLARWLAGKVRMRSDAHGRGQGFPERMQYVVNEIGWPRVLFAAACSAVTRPFRIPGAFYLITGQVSRALDGMTWPWEGCILPPLSRRDGAALATSLAAALGQPVAVVDINIVGGEVRATSPGALPAKELHRALRDDPMGYEKQSTPIGIVRPIATVPEGGH